MIPHPPQLKGFEVRHLKTLRFVANAPFLGDISFQNLLDLILFSTTAAAPFDLFWMVRVVKVKAWALPILGSAATVSVIFDGSTAGSQGDRDFHTDTSMGIEPAFVNAAPKSRTLALMFQVSSAASAFFLDVPTGAVIDVTLEFHSDVIGHAPVAAQNASVASVVGAIGLRGLDGVALAATKFNIPAGLNQI